MKQRKFYFNKELETTDPQTIIVIHERSFAEKRQSAINKTDKMYF